MLEELLKSIPQVLKVADARRQIRQANSQHRTRIVVLDDDPTGCQTVHDISVLTIWTEEILRQALEEDCFYILSNSRACTEQQAMQINRDIGKSLAHLVEKNKLKVVSRSDSTLRGHFPAETDVLSETLGPFDGIIITPYFKAGGRLTVNDTHYVLQGDMLTPADQTEFAKDPVFGFSTAHLPSWIEEKSQGRWKQGDVLCVSLSDIRTGGPERVCEKLMKAERGRPIVFNALCDEDMEVAVLGLCKAEANGKHFLYRTAASFVKIRAGIDDWPLYRPAEPKGPGIVLVGSFVQKSTDQLNYLLEHAEIRSLQIEIAKVLVDDDKSYFNGCVKQIDDTLAAKENMVIYTERNYALKGSGDQRLEAGKRISDFLSDLMVAIRTEPEFIIAKGGITSHEVARRGLGVKKAMVLGQILPGVPIWRLGSEARFPEIPYVVFPGNVGGVEAVFEAFKILNDGN